MLLLLNQPGPLETRKLPHEHQPQRRALCTGAGSKCSRTSLSALAEYGKGVRPSRMAGDDAPSHIRSHTTEWVQCSAPKERRIKAPLARKSGPMQRATDGGEYLGNGGGGIGKPQRDGGKAPAIPEWGGPGAMEVRGQQRNSEGAGNPRQNIRERRRTDTTGEEQLAGCRALHARRLQITPASSERRRTSAPSV